MNKAKKILLNIVGNIFDNKLDLTKKYKNKMNHKCQIISGMNWVLILKKKGEVNIAEVIITDDKKSKRFLNNFKYEINVIRYTNTEVNAMGRFWFILNNILIMLTLL